MSHRIRLLGAAAALLLLGVILSGCGTAPAAQTWPGLAVIDGSVYVNSGQPQQVYSLDAETGVQQGTLVPTIPGGQVVEPTYWSPVTVGGGRVYVGFGDPTARPPIHGLYAFDPETRMERWHTEAKDLILGAPDYVDGVVYFGTSDGQLYAVDAETEQVKAGWPFKAKEAIWASPLVAEGRVYAASMDHHLYCVDAESGVLIWDFEAGGAMGAAPILEDGTLYFGDFDGRIYAVQADSGEETTPFDFRAENWIWSEPLLVDGTLYVTSLDGKLYALDLATGASLPGYPYDAESPLRAAPVQAGDLIIIAAESGRVTAITGATGVMRWQWPSGTPEAPVRTTPVVADGKVYVVLNSE
ncbi:MAG: PQQ-binding-like beta-propeller repeat protein, partial [Anaerolineae bacterium]